MITNAEFHIDLPPLPQIPLAPLWMARGSNVFVSVPILCQGWLADVEMVLTPPGATDSIAVSLDRWGCAWVEAYMAPSVGSGSYELRAKKDGRWVWLGKGDLNVFESPAFGDPLPVGPVDREINAGYWPVEKDPSGEIFYSRLTMSVEPETGERVLSCSKELYKFNKGVGRYEAV